MSGKKTVSLLIKDKLLQEINLIPEDKLIGLYNFIYYFWLGLEKSKMKVDTKPVLAFAGCWQDIPDALFDDFMEDLSQRRHEAFRRRMKSS